jgi:regulator of cell morphogenesis and NO signaling
MTLCTEKTVREYAVETPHAARVFEKLKIDYCCGGGRPLGEAARLAGVPLDEVERLLEQAKDISGEVPAGAPSGTLTELIDYILDKHHAFTRDEMERLDALAGKVALNHGGRAEGSGIKTRFLNVAVDLKDPSIPVVTLPLSTALL